MVGPRVGERVSWRTRDGRRRGTVVGRRRAPFTLSGESYAASDNEPVFVLECERTGAKVVHPATALRVLKS